MIILKLIYTKILPLGLLGLAAFFATAKWKGFVKPLKIAAAICVFNFFMELAGYWMASKKMHNAWLYNVADVVRYMLWLYYFSLSFSWVQKIYTTVLLIIYPLIYIITFFIQPIATYQTISFISGGVLLFSCCVLFFVNEYKSISTQKISLNPHFWICTGLLIYYALNLPFIGLYNLLFKTTPGFSKVYFLVCVIGSSLMLSIFMIKAFTCRLAQKKYGISL